MAQQRKIIIFITALFIASSVYLSWVSQRATDPIRSGNFWSLYFSDPKSEKFDFVIENYSEMSDFEWKILGDGKEIDEGDIKIGKGGKKEIKTDFDGTTYKINKVETISGGEKKDIYRNFSN